MLLENSNRTLLSSMFVYSHATAFLSVSVSRGTAVPETSFQLPKRVYPQVVKLLLAGLVVLHRRIIPQVVVKYGHAPHPYGSTPEYAEARRSALPRQDLCHVGEVKVHEV